MRGLVHDQVVIVTGCANERGIGYATVVAMIEHGAKAIIMVDKDPAVVHIAKEFNEKSENTTLIGFTVNVKIKNDLENVVDYAIQEFGRIDSVVNSAAVNAPSTAEDVDGKSFIDAMMVNVFSQAVITGLVVRHMKRQGGGSIVNLSSANAFVSELGLWTYGTTKGAISQSTQQMGLQYAPFNIRVNAVAPGAVNTGFNQNHYNFLGITQEEADKDIARLHATGRPIEPEEVAMPILFLCSPYSTSIIGTTLSVDAGMSIH